MDRRGADEAAGWRRQDDDDVLDDVLDDGNLLMDGGANADAGRAVRRGDRRSRRLEGGRLMLSMREVVVWLLQFFGTCTRRQLGTVL